MFHVYTISQRFYDKNVVKLVVNFNTEHCDERVSTMTLLFRMANL